MDTGYRIPTSRLMRILSLVFIVLFTAVTGELVRAQMPNTLNYQGVLNGADGKPVADGQYNLTFKLYTQATGGSALWSETQNTTVTNGVFSVLLGKVTSLATIPFDKPYWLGITVGSGSEMTPRVELSASPYSLRARAVTDSSVTGMSIASGQVIRNVNGMTDSVMIAAGNNVSIQKSAHKLTISSTGGDSSPWSTSNNNIAYTAGNVGIGAYSGGSAELLVSSQSSVTDPQLRLHETTSGYSRLNFDNGSGANNFWAIAGLNSPTRADERLNFYNHATGDLMSITGDGRVGIGVGATSQNSRWELTVNTHHFIAGYFTSDSSNGRGLYGVNETPSGVGIVGTGGQVGIIGDGEGGVGQGFTEGVEGEAYGSAVNYGVYGDAYNGTTNYAVYANGDLAYTGSLIQITAKTTGSAGAMGPVLNKIMEINPQSYTPGSGSGYQTAGLSAKGIHYGITAQDVEKAFPSLVVDAVDPGINPQNPKAPRHPVHYKGVKYMQMIPILLEAIKEQQQEIQQLKSEVAQLKK